MVEALARGNLDKFVLAQRNRMKVVLFPSTASSRWSAARRTVRRTRAGRPRSCCDPGLRRWISIPRADVALWRNRDTLFGLRLSPYCCVGPRSRLGDGSLPRSPRWLARDSALAGCSGAPPERIDG